MFSFLALLTALHAIPGIFWAGTTFAIVRAEGANAERLAGPQVGAGIFTLIVGAALWHFTHEGSFGSQEKWLALGAACALAAVIVQIWSLQTTRSRGANPPRTLAAQRGAAVLLLVTVFVMVTSRYA